MIAMANNCHRDQHTLNDCKTKNRSAVMCPIKSLMSYRAMLKYMSLSPFIQREADGYVFNIRVFILESCLTVTK